MLQDGSNRWDPAKAVKGKLTKVVIIRLSMLSLETQNIRRQLGSMTIAEFKILLLTSLGIYSQNSCSCASLELPTGLFPEKQSRVSGTIGGGKSPADGGTVWSPVSPALGDVRT